jgi:hypothetical protein
MERDKETFKPRRSEKEQRRMDAELLYDFEMEARRQGFLKDPALVYDEEHDLFRFRDGKFAFCGRCDGAARDPAAPVPLAVAPMARIGEGVRSDSKAICKETGLLFALSDSQQKAES